MPREFQARLTARGPGGAWTFLLIPFDVNEAFGTKGRVSVSGTINGAPFRNSLMPEGDGTHAMMVNKGLQTAAKARAGDLVAVALRRDDTERTVEVPAELQRALKSHAVAKAFFAKLSYSCRKEYADWIAGAKQAATRESRAAKALEMLAAGQKRVR